MSEKRAELADVVHRNIASLQQTRQEFEQQKSTQDRAADKLTAFAGSLLFVYLHAVIVVLWFTINLGLLPGIAPFDPYPFVMLAMVASVEAIFLSTFVLISQNRSAILDEQRAELNLQINLLAEHETTRLIELVDAISQHLGIDVERRPDVDQLKKDVSPEAVLQEIEAANREAESGTSPAPRPAK
jgi:uncharacterized membrane protein